MLSTNQLKFFGSFRIICSLRPMLNFTAHKVIKITRLDLPNTSLIKRNSWFSLTNPFTCSD